LNVALLKRASSSGRPELLEAKMTVAELIAVLQKLPPEKPVALECEGCVRELTPKRIVDGTVAVWLLDYDPDPGNVDFYLGDVSWWGKD
jgi:hypothetical protein